MGVPLLEPQDVEKCLSACDLAFMFAPKFHPAMKHVVPVRRALGIRTVFNILGPLLNPAGAQRLVLGVYDPKLMLPYGKALVELGNVQHALVVHCHGLDELNPLGISKAVEVTAEHGVREITVDPFKMGIPQCKLEDLRGGSKEHNAKFLRRILSGDESIELDAAAHTIALNTGAALYVAHDDVASIGEGYQRALAALRNGSALAKLDEWIRVANEINDARAKKQKT